MIYFVQSPNGGPIKIGTTTRLVDRLVQLEFEVSRHLVVLGVMAGSIGNERKLHARFFHLASLSMPGTEWFDPDAELLRYVDENTRAWHPDDDDEDPSLNPFSPRSDRVHITLELSREQRDFIKRRATRRREPLKRFIKRAIDELMERESKLGTILESDVTDICDSYKAVMSLQQIAYEYGVEIDDIKKVLSGEMHPHIVREPVPIKRSGAQRVTRPANQLPTERGSQADVDRDREGTADQEVRDPRTGHPGLLFQILRDEAQEKTKEGS